MQGSAATSAATSALLPSSGGADFLGLSGSRGASRVCITKGTTFISTGATSFIDESAAANAVAAEPTAPYSTSCYMSMTSSSGSYPTLASAPGMLGPAPVGEVRSSRSILVSRFFCLKGFFCTSASFTEIN